MGGAASLPDAIRKNNPKALAMLIRNGKYDVNERNSDGESPLMLACLSGNTELVSVLLKGGAKPNLYLHTGGGGTALHFATIGYTSHEYDITTI